MNIKGKLLEISNTQQVSASFKKREFVLEYAENTQYPEYLKFELTQDKCGLIDGYNVNDEVNVHFNLKGRKWTDPKGEVKYFNSLQAWKLERGGGSAPKGSSSAGESGGMDAMDEPGWTSDDKGDLPF